MYWNNYGKVDSLKNDNKSLAMKFRYDPMGNRIEKRLYHLDGTGAVVRQRATHYVRDAQGNPLAVYELLGGDTVVLNEFNLYGSNRLGMLTTADTLVCASCTTAVAPSVYLSPVGMKRYELSNHLGNVMSVISDKVVPIDTSNDGLWDYFNPSLVSATDYYPFGMGMPGRGIYINNYRFMFNGIEMSRMTTDNSVFFSFKFREYNPCLSRFWSIDPLFKLFSWNSSYAFSENSPVKFIDFEGKERLPAEFKSDNSGFTTAIDNSYRNTATKIDAINHWNYLNKSPDPGTIKQNEPNIFERADILLSSKSDDLFESALKFGGKMLYNTVNDLHIITTGIVYSRPEAYDLRGVGVNQGEFQDAGISTLTNLVPIHKFTKYSIGEIKSMSYSMYTRGYNNTGLLNSTTKLNRTSSLYKYNLKIDNLIKSTDDIKNTITILSIGTEAKQNERQKQ